MQHFVIVFRQGPRELNKAELASRADETRLWAQRQNALGHALDPRMLSPESYSTRPEDDRAGATSAGKLTALLFLDAVDLQQAVDVARSHPGLRYGATIEVRPWTKPQARP
jgi:hypothetical protein